MQRIWLLTGYSCECQSAHTNLRKLYFCMFVLKYHEYAIYSIKIDTIKSLIVLVFVLFHFLQLVKKLCQNHTNDVFGWQATRLLTQKVVFFIFFFLSVKLSRVNYNIYIYTHKPSTQATWLPAITTWDWTLHVSNIGR